MLLVQAILNGIQMGFLYALVAVGLTIIWGLMEMINFAHGEFLMLGMFGSWWLSATYGLDPLVAMLPIGLALYGLGVLVYTQLMRRVQKGDAFTQIFATVGLFFLLQNVAVATFTSDFRFVSDTVLTRLSGTNLSILGLTLGVPLLLAAGLALVMFLVLYALIDRTEFGLALQATSEDREAAMLVGSRPQRMFAVAWGIGAALVAIAGAILANFFAVYPQVGFPFFFVRSVANKAAAGQYRLDLPGKTDLGVGRGYGQCQDDQGQQSSEGTQRRHDRRPIAS